LTHATPQQRYLSLSALFYIHTQSLQSTFVDISAKRVRDVQLAVNVAQVTVLVVGLLAADAVWHARD